MVQQRLPSQIDPPIAFAHRGASAHAPENTIEAFQLALRLGATGLESDVWLTSDGVPVLDHDGIVRAGLRKKPIAEMPRSKLPAYIPSLEDLFGACGTDFQLSLDLKVDGAGEAVIDLVLHSAPQLLDRLWLCHPEVDALALLRGRADGVKLVDSTRLARMKEGPERRAAALARRGIDAVNMHHSDWTGGLTTLFHRFDRTVFAWDLQHDRLLRQALRMGCDGVFSDWVDRMVDAFRAEVGGT